MEYSKDLNDDSPGSVVAAAVADLYKELENDPSRYPRGLTVRILLGNRPPLGELELNAMLWRLLSDLRDAGVPEMVNPELGWRLEVANYEGAWPHSHAKIVVIDGKTLVAAGFNMEYHHLPPDHSSGLGKGTADAAIQVTGPVAQDGRRAFDELWEGATQRHCSNLFPNGPDQLWWRTCRDTKAISDHVPEVKRYYLPGGDSIAFSLLRTEVYDEADQQVTAALAAAEERIDVIHTMFTLPSICILNYLLDVCSVSQAMPYMQSILDAVEQNQANARLLIDLEPIKGIENALALDVLQAEVEARGLSDRVEIRSFPGPVHAKDTLIDDEFLIVGSHNFHWSAWGEGQGLAEYSLGVADPQAISDFERYFEYQWERAENE
jgi:phosphatidylserine/phosphatidylglycerophosphate/cardiolipin synthase-like enzyme